MHEFALKPIPKAKYNRGNRNFIKNLHKALQKKVRVKKLNVKTKLEKFLPRIKKMAKRLVKVKRQQEIKRKKG